MIKLKRNSQLIFFLFSITIISFFMKYISEWTHEFLGHCGFGLLVGGTPIEWYVSWIWPLEFGYARVSVSGDIPRAIMLIGGISACFIAAVISNLIIFLMRKKKFRKKESVSAGVLLILHVLFWYGFWTFLNSVGYLIIGGITKFGDIGTFSNITGIPSWIFTIIGFIAFLGFYYIISYNVFLDFQLLFPEVSEKMILSIFWLIIPILLTFLVLNPGIAPYFSLWIILVSIGLMFIPSLIMYFFSQKFKFSNNPNL